MVLDPGGERLGRGRPGGLVPELPPPAAPIIMIIIMFTMIIIIVIIMFTTILILIVIMIIILILILLISISMQIITILGGRTAARSSPRGASSCELCRQWRTGAWVMCRYTAATAVCVVLVCIIAI